MDIEFLLLLKGLFIGMVMSSPFGPIGLIFMQRSLENEKYEGVASGFGIATGDMFYSIITTFGLTLLDDLFDKYATFIKIVALAILLFMAVRTMRAKIEFDIKEGHQRNLFRAFMVSFLLALHNPSTIVIFALLFRLFRIGEIISLRNGFLLILGIYAGSTALWLILNSFIHYVKKKDKLGYLLIFYRLSGVLLLLMSVLLLRSIFI